MTKVAAEFAAKAEQGWSKVRHALWKRMWPVLNHTEFGLIGNIVADSIGRYDPRRVVEIKGEGTWCQLKIKDLARMAGVTPDWMGRMIARMIECRAIEDRPNPHDKRTRIYRALQDNWQKVSPDLIRELRPKWDKESAAEQETGAAEQETADEGSEAPQAHPVQLRLVLEISGRQQEVDLHEAGLCSGCVHKLEHLVDQPKNTPENTGRTDSLKPLNGNHKRKKIPEVELGYFPPTGLRKGLNAILSKTLGPVTVDTTRRVLAALDGATPEELFNRVRQRKSMFRPGRGTWGGVLALAAELGEAARLARRDEDEDQREHDAEVAIEDSAARLRDEVERLLADPSATDQDRAFARRILGKAAPP